MVVYSTPFPFHARAVLRQREVAIRVPQ